jgi:hypothetical protein
MRRSFLFGRNRSRGIDYDALLTSRNRFRAWLIVREHGAPYALTIFRLQSNLLSIRTTGTLRVSGNLPFVLRFDVRLNSMSYASKKRLRINLSRVRTLVGGQKVFHLSILTWMVEWPFRLDESQAPPDDKIMIDPETLEVIATSKAKRQIELSARLISSKVPTADQRLDGRQRAEAQTWKDIELALSQAAQKYSGDGLRVLRHEKTRHGLVLTGSVSTWRCFLKEQSALVKEPCIEFKHYIKPWSFGLPGFPE